MPIALRARLLLQVRLFLLQSTTACDDSIFIALCFNVKAHQNIQRAHRFSFLLSYDRYGAVAYPKLNALLQTIGRTIPGV